MQSQRAAGLCRGPSIFRRCARHAELAQLLDESRAAQVEEARGVGDRATAALERLLDETALDAQQMDAQVDAVSGQLCRAGILECARRLFVRGVRCVVRRETVVGCDLSG